MQGKSLNATAASLLGLLHDGPANGSRLCALAHQRLGPFWSTTRSQVYRELPLLQERGYVEAGEPGKRHSLPYSVTPSGRRAFGKWMTSVSLVDSIRIPVLLVASFSHLARPEQIEKLLLAEIGRRFGVEQEIRSAIAVASDEGRACVAQALTLAATLQGELLDCLTQLTSMLPSQPGDQS